MVMFLATIKMALIMSLVNCRILNGFLVPDTISSVFSDKKARIGESAISDRYPPKIKKI